MLFCRRNKHVVITHWSRLYRPTSYSLGPRRISISSSRPVRRPSSVPSVVRRPSRRPSSVVVVVRRRVRLSVRPVVRRPSSVVRRPSSVPSSVLSKVKIYNFSIYKYNLININVNVMQM